MPTRFKKSRKLRGHVSAGHGRVGKHRKHPGGRGNAGAEHHHRINVFKYHPDYIGKHGMRRFHDTSSRLYYSACNVFDIWGRISVEDRKTILESEKMPTVDLSLLGIHNVLGSGAPPPKPMIVKARYFTKLAREKLERIGGQCVLVGNRPPKEKKKKTDE